MPRSADCGHRKPQVYDHRLRRLVFESQDITLALDLGVPRSTASGWLRSEPTAVVTLDVVDVDQVTLWRDLLHHRHRFLRVAALCRLLLALVRVLGLRLDARRLPAGGKATLLAAIERARDTLPLRTILTVLGLSPARYHAWAREDARCTADSDETCLRRTPNQLSPQELRTIREMVTDPNYRHVPTGRLALLAQRLGKVFASSSTWYRLVRERGWRRPRVRVHPSSPKVGLRTTRPNQAWHVDTTVIRLLDGTKLFLHGVIDNYSRKILAWRLTLRLEAASCAAVLLDALAAASVAQPPMTVMDGGTENFSSPVDQLVDEHLLRRLRAQTDQLRFSNSLIEASWRSLKHYWLYLNTLDSPAAVERLIASFVAAHNTLPHSAFAGQTPDEMYSGTGEKVPDQLAAARATARAARLQANRSRTCATCPRSAPAVAPSEEDQAA